MSFSGVVTVGKTYIRRNGLKSTCLNVREDFYGRGDIAIFDTGLELWATGYRNMNKRSDTSDVVEELPTEINLSELL